MTPMVEVVDERNFKMSLDKHKDLSQSEESSSFVVTHITTRLSGRSMRLFRYFSSLILFKADQLADMSDIKKVLGPDTLKESNKSAFSVTLNNAHT